MYHKGKYVVGRISESYAGVGAIISDEVVNHSTLGKLFVPGTIVGAGFFHINEKEEVKVYGSSSSLKIASRPEDEQFVGRALALPKYQT